MASEKILKQKQAVVEEIKSHVESATSIVLFDYRGLTDNETKELRTKLKESGTFYKVFKNTLMARALSDLNIDIYASLVGPSALAYGTDQIAPIKILIEIAKKNDAIWLKVGVVDALNGPSALVYGTDQVAPVKTLTEFAKDHPALELKIGVIDGEIADKAKLAEYASLPSRDGLLTMLAGGMIGLVRDLSICLDLYSQQKEEN